jgi:hypothetical protein
MNSVKPLRKRGLIGEIRIYNLNNQEQEFFVEFVDHRKKHRLFIFHSLTQEDILACLSYAADRERQTLLISQ